MNTFIHSFKLDCSSISISEFCQTLVRRIMLASAKKWKTLLFPPLRNQIIQWENYVPQSTVRVFLLIYSCPMVLWQVNFISRLAFFGFYGHLFCSSFLWFIFHRFFLSLVVSLIAHSFVCLFVCMKWGLTLQFRLASKSEMTLPQLSWGLGLQDSYLESISCSLELRK